MSTILVTGSAGFIGFHTARHLLEDGETVIGIDNLNAYYSPKLKKDRNTILKKYKNYRFFCEDIGNFKNIEKIFKKHKIDKICHLAAQAGVRYSLINPFAYLKSNMDGFLVILELARKYNIQDIVYASSSSVYGNNKKVPFAETDRVDTPISLYAATKKANELMAHTYHHLFGLNLVGLRFFTVYGPWGRPDMALFSFTENIAQGKEIQLFNHGQMLRDFTYIEDIVDGLVSSLARVSKIKHAVINLGNNKPEKLSKFVELIEQSLGKKALKKYLPLQAGDLTVTRASVAKAKKLLGYTPRTKLEKGIPQFVEWWQNYTEH